MELEKRNLTKEKRKTIMQREARIQVIFMSTVTIEGRNSDAKVPQGKCRRTGMLYRMMSTRSAISAIATTTVTSTAIQPAVIKGRPNILPCSCPTVFNPWSISRDSLFRSAKSCVQCRERKNARMKRRPPRIAKTRPTENKGLALLKQR